MRRSRRSAIWPTRSTGRSPSRPNRRSNCHEEDILSAVSAPSAGGCGSKPAPAWIAAGHKQLETFKQDFLTGRAPRITEIHFRNAVEEIKKGGDADLLGKAWLTRMALQVAVLREMEEGDYVKIEAAETVPANRNFYRFLTGNTAAVDVFAPAGTLPSVLDGVAQR